MKHVSEKSSKFLKIGAVLFCFMCLFFAVSMASKYEQQKTEAEIHRNKVKELEEKVRELSVTNQELMQIRSVLAQEKEQLAKELSALREKPAEADDWKLTSKKEPFPATQSDTAAPSSEPEETSINK